MRKALKLLGFVLLIDLLGTLLIEAVPSRQRLVEFRDGRTNVTWRLNVGRALSYLGIFPAISLAQDRPSPSHSPVNISYQQAQPILEALSESLLPAGLKNRSPAEIAALWPAWVTLHDQETRARLLRGDEDTMVNFLVLGTSFTRQPPLTARQFNNLPGCHAPSSSPPAADDQPECAVFVHRVDDLLRGLARPGNNERLLFLSHLAEREGYHPRTAYGAHPDLAEQRRLRTFVLTNVTRVGNEHEQSQAEYERARKRDDQSENVAAISTLYRSRGLSLDTSLLPNLAVEESLQAMEMRGLIAAGSVRHAAVIGPGLDFTDKSDGYDFYPQQTLQCYALVDTLFRLGLARRGDLEVTTFDISPRVNDHLRRARHRAELGQAYVLQLPRPAQASWKQATSDYWQRFGNQIGTAAVTIRPPALAGSVETRAVGIRPSIVSLVTPVELNIVTQHLDLPPHTGFDLIIATNVFCYFDSFEQLLAFANVQSMLRPGGFLLSNNTLPLLPSSPMRWVDSVSISYSDRPNDGDVIVWYQRSPD
jgi:hypothetical protein